MPTRFTIITPSFNQCSYLARTAQSILSQQGDFSIRWLVIDGGSTDGTLELLGSLRDPRLTWSSEPDAGQSHAINKGLTLAYADGAADQSSPPAASANDIVSWLNSDDRLADGALSAVAQAFAASPQADWLIGRCDIIDAEDRPIRPAVTAYKDRALARYSHRRLLRENFISQPAVFWRRSFGQSTGLLDESLHWTMDYDLWLRMARASRPLVLDKLLAHFRFHTASKSGKVDRRQFDEQYTVACRYFDGDQTSRVLHRLNVEKIVWAYRFLRILAK